MSALPTVPDGGEHAFIDKTIANYEGRPGALLGILEAIQEHHPHKYLPADALQYVATTLDIPLSRAYSFTTYYALFRMPRIAIRMGTCGRGNGAARKTYMSRDVRVGLGEVYVQFFPKLLAITLSLAAFAGPAFSADEKVDASTDAAQQWLALIDSGQYGESWFQASNDFRGSASKEQWIHALNTVRAPLGKLQSRQLNSATYTNRLPNTRPGEYVVMQYDTNYEKASRIVETVVTVQEKNGAWKVSGYFIKRAGSGQAIPH